MWKQLQLRRIFLSPWRKTLPLVEKTGSDPSGTRRFSNLDFSGRETVFDPYGVHCLSGPGSVGSCNLSNLAFAGESVRVSFDGGTQWLPIKRELVTRSIRFKV